jgi:predicted DNA-binding transcriptional regulator YafY
MNRIDRLTAILIQLQTKRWITSAEIAERFEISQRTVYRDIRALEKRVFLLVLRRAGIFYC